MSVSLNMAMCLILLLCMSTAVLADEVPNQCPQPTPQRPTPPSNQFQYRRNNIRRDNAERECAKYPGIVIPHSRVCQRYYNCSHRTSNGHQFEEHEDECPYPELFHVVEKKCKPYKETYCGPLRNTVGKAPCEYLKNQCLSPHCHPCSDRLPSCVGRQDGRQENPHRLWTPYYIMCKDERTVGANLICPKHGPTDYYALFSPDKKVCVSLWEVPQEHGGYAPTCDGKAPGQYQTDQRPDIFYTCPGAQVDYCGVGSVFSESISRCERR